MKDAKAILRKIQVVYVRDGKTTASNTVGQFLKTHALDKGIPNRDVADAIFATAISGKEIEIPEGMPDKDAKIVLKVHADLVKKWGEHLAIEKAKEAEKEAAAEELKKKKAEEKAAKEAEKVAKAAAAKAKAEEAEKERALHEKAQAKLSQKAELAVVKGAVLATKGTEHFLDSLQKGIGTLMGKGFTVTPTGLVIEKGAFKNEEDALTKVAALCGLTEGLNSAKTLAGFALGDLVIALKEQFANVSDNLIYQAVSTEGQAKHTIRECERICLFFKHDMRRPDFTFTHHAEIFNYRLTLPAEELSKIMDAAYVVEAKGKKAGGEEFEVKKPISTLKLRERLVERGKTMKPDGTLKTQEEIDKEATTTPAPAPTPTPATPAEPVQTKSEAAPSNVIEAEFQLEKKSPDQPAGTAFIIIDLDTAEIWRSVTLPDSVLADENKLRIDLYTNRFVNSDGSEGDPIPVLPERFFKPQVLEEASGGVTPVEELAEAPKGAKPGTRSSNRVSVGGNAPAETLELKSDEPQAASVSADDDFPA